MESADTIINARWIAPVEPPGALLEFHSLVVTAGEITALAPTAEVAARYTAAVHVRLDEHLLIPGLVNLHTHAAMTLMRGLADDKPLMEWLREHIWPVETQMVSAAFVHDGTLLACAEMLRGGTTCFSDMYFFPDAAGRAAVELAMRAALGVIVIDIPSLYAGDARDYLAKGLAMRDALRDERLISFCMAPHAPYTASDATLESVATYAAELDIPIHMHVHETEDEIRDSVAERRMRPLERLEKLGMLGPGLIAVHAVHLDGREIDSLAHHGCSVAHCPSSNLKLASGIAPVAQMLTSGINVGVGTDGAASNNRLDTLNEMRTAALLAKGASGSATALPAHAALRMGTLAGAQALGLGAAVGSLVVGKRADVTAVRLDGVELSPIYDPVSHLVYASGREHVTHVWVDGKLRVADGLLVDVDTRELQLKAAHWKEKIRKTA